MNWIQALAQSTNHIQSQFYGIRLDQETNNYLENQKTFRLTSRIEKLF